MKRCSLCKRELPMDNFYKRRDSNGKEGHRSRCKSCYQATYNSTPKHKAWAAKYRETPKYKTWLAKHCQTPMYKLTKARGRRVHRSRHPEQWGAYRAVYRNKKNGRLPSPDTLFCEICRRPAQEYHHHLGYNKEHWLDVVPLCRPCHLKVA